MNTPRTADWLYLKRLMVKCQDISQLQTMKNLVLKYHEEKKQDSGELLAIYIERETDLNPEGTIIGNDKFNIRLQNKQL